MAPPKVRKTMINKKRRRERKLCNWTPPPLPSPIATYSSVRASAAGLRQRAVSSPLGSRDLDSYRTPGSSSRLLSGAQGGEVKEAKGKK